MSSNVHHYELRRPFLTIANRGGKSCSKSARPPKAAISNASPMGSSIWLTLPPNSAVPVLRRMAVSLLL